MGLFDKPGFPSNLKYVYSVDVFHIIGNTVWSIN